VKYAKAGTQHGIVWSIQTEKNRLVKAVVKDKSEDFVNWDKAEHWVNKTLNMYK